MFSRLLTFVALMACTSLALAEVKPFTFIHFSDTHIGGPTNSIMLTTALKDVDEQYPDSAFIIVTGDCTEFGFEDELTSYVETIGGATKRKVYSAAGNHDSRWSDSGKENFRRIVAPTYQSFDHNGMRFILMDSSMLIEQYAHFDGQQMKRLEEELKSLPPDHPAVIAMHHPPLSPGKYFDNEQEFAELISRYNVPVVLTGHGHGFLRYIRNGTHFAMGGSTYGTHPDQGAYAVYTVTPERMTRSLRRFVRGKTEEDVTFATQRAINGLRVRQVGEGDSASTAPVNGKLRFMADRETTPGVALAGTWSVDSVLTGTSSAELGNFVELDPAQFSPGIHQLTLEVEGVTSSTDIGALLFRTESAETTGPRITRAFPLKSGTQSHPAVDGDVLYVGANDGFLRAFDLAGEDGKVLWEKKLGNEVVSGPAVTTHSVVVGSMDGHVYCLDKATGDEQWKLKTDTAVFASPLVANETVYIGSGDDHLYAIDLKTGALRWKFPARAHIKMTPALADGKLFFGAWDNTFYCINAADGSLVWKVPVGVEPPRYSAATCNPVATDKGTVIVCSHDYSIRSFDQKTGAQTWIYKPTKEELGPSYSAGVVKGGVVYFGSINGHAVGHDILTGEKVFDVDLRPTKTDPVFDSYPLLVGNKLYMGTVGGNLYCVSIPQKKVAWSVALQPGAIFTQPAWWNGKLLVGSMSNQVFEVATRGD